MKSIVFIFGITFLGLNVFGQYSTTEILKFNSKILNQERVLKISVPSDYNEFPNRKYKVVYLFDAQSESLYNFAKQTLSYLENINFYVDPVIFVGIVTKNRQFEFLPKNKTNLPLKDYWAQVKLGGADSLALCLKNEILPFINEKYRTNGYTIGVGHSLGASFVTYSMFMFPEIFNAGVAVSPNFYYDDEQFLTIFKNEIGKNILKDKFLYVCYGQGDKLEDRFKPSSIKFSNLLSKTNTPNFHYKVQNIDNNSHSTTPLEGFFKGLVFVNQPMTIQGDIETKYLESKTLNYVSFLKIISLANRKLRD
ncbi:MAG: alpha/beta hydrolase [Chitinophagaceae bacterium]|nr:alpha/beta hydrolase [Chitinophagaceae bacterium]